VKLTALILVAMLILGSSTVLSTNDASAAEVPGKCTGVNAILIFGVITIGGNFPANHVEADIKGLHVYRGMDEGNLTLHDTLTAYVNTVYFFMYQDDNFDHGVEYFYRVAAFNAQGDGELSDLMTIRCNGTPPMPRDVEVQVDYGSVALNWNVPVSDGGRPITNYSVFRGALGAEPVWIANVTGLSYKDDNVTAKDQFYSYEICAVNEYGAGKRSGRLFVDLPQPYINGTVMDGATPVDGVRVEIDGNASTMVTDVNGTFSFQALPGAHVIRVWINDELECSLNATLAETPINMGNIAITPPDTGPGTTGDGLMLFGAIGAAVAAALVIGILVMRRKR